VNLWAIIPLASCATFAILFVLVLQQAGTRANKVFAAFLFVSGVWSFCAFMLDYRPTASSYYLIFWNGLVIAAIPWVVVAYYHFIRAYENKPAGFGVFLGYALVLTLLVLSLKGYVVKSAYFVNGFLVHDIKPWDYVIAAIVIPYLAIIIYALFRRYRRSEDAVDRNKTAYLTAGWTILLIVSYITPFTTSLSGLPIDHLGNLANALIIAYTISRYRLLDIRLMIRRGVAFALTIIPIAALFVLGILFLFDNYPTMPLYSILLLTLSSSILLGLIFLPLRRPMQMFVDRVFYRGTYDYRQTLLDFTGKMGNILDIDQLAKEMLQTLSKAIHVSRAILLFEDPASGFFQVRSSYPESKEESENQFRLHFDSPIVTWLQEQADPLNMRQIGSMPQFKALWEEERQSLSDSHLELLCPLKGHGKLIGIMGLSRKRSNRIYTQEDIDLVVSVANQAGVLVENAQLYSQALTWAITDGLTKLYNHRHMHEYLDKEIARCSRFGTIFSLIMIDIDFFKTYNDTYGHLAGDEVLAGVARCIQSSIRTIDTAFRYGGEEFIVILPETTIEGAFVVADRIRAKIEERVFSGRSSVTASLGIANWPADGTSKEDILLSVDRALYAAKETGRNKVCAPIDITKPGLATVDAASETQRIAVSMIFALAATVDAKDHYTYGHSRKVSQYTVAMARTMNLPEDTISIIRTSGLLHDIGKIGIPDSILNKRGTLTAEEWRRVKAHPEMGVDILRYVAELANALPVILNHHEHYDGSGYPAGIRGKQIPLEARLLAIADAYDAMTSLRPYHKQRSSQEAIEEIRRCAGTSFDPELVEVFCKTLESLEFKGEEKGGQLETPPFLGGYHQINKRD